ncbi:T6SS phospholipase effector Tle1-like catalytic domain-containing protein [Noviherbaspirillum saxi]|nr:DUF2235 domain-containing protein [Noviherbaspirillum saxi]
MMKICISSALCLALSLTLCACITAPSEELITSSDGINNQQPKNLFVFLDGTRNNQNTATNVWHLREIISKEAGSTMPTETIYIEGVGSAENPISGMTLGFGMESRILRAYRFLIERYKAGDRIYIFGFSRGAHQARALAGLLSYSGIPSRESLQDKDLLKVGNRILEITKTKSDKDLEDQWNHLAHQRLPPLTSEIESKLGLQTMYVEIEFLGIWDTVPGSSFKTYSGCKETENSQEGERYKTDSYPPIKHIAHAVSLDEKRSMFSPLLVCPRVKSGNNTIVEVWFPGAHADVGGGYEDYNDLAPISLRWMLDRLKTIYPIRATSYPPEGVVLGISHWSMGDFPANFRSECIDRKIPDNAIIHPSMEERARVSSARIVINDQVLMKQYPLSCKDMQ